MKNLKSKRKVSTVLALDVVGYSRLMEAGEEAAHEKLMALRSSLLIPRVEQHGGRVVKHTGDGFLATFDEAVEAARSAISIQKELTFNTLQESEAEKIVLRMGLHLCDTIVEEEDIYGEGINIVSRLYTYAEPGDIVISDSLATVVLGAFPDINVLDLGELHLKNIRKPIHAYSLRIGSLATRLAPSLYRLPDNRPSIAVLPFRKLRPRPEDAYFADGVVEEIIHLLSGLKELFVISRTSTLKFADSEFDARSIGRELGVRYILYGSIRRAGDRLRIGTELTDTDTGRIIRSDFHEGEITDIFKLQEKIATQVAKAIAPHVREMELQRTRRKHPSNFTAYDLVLQALDLLYRVDRESVARARGLLQQAISLDPSFAQSYSYMAYLLVFRVGESWSPNPREDAREAARVASKAIEIEPNDAQAWAIYGHVQSFLLKDFKTAMTYLDRALEVGPNNAMAWTMSSATCGYVGNGQAAVERAEHGLRLSPLDAHVFWHEAILAQAHYINGDFQQAIAWAERAAEHKATAIFNLRTLTASLIALGRIQEAAETWGHLLSIQPDFDLAAYEEGCPFQQPLLGVWMQRLRIAAKAHEGHRQRSHPWSEQSSRRKEQYHDG